MPADFKRRRIYNFPKKGRITEAWVNLYKNPAAASTGEVRDHLYKNPITIGKLRPVKYIHGFKWVEEYIYMERPG